MAAAPEQRYHHRHQTDPDLQQDYAHQGYQGDYPQARQLNQDQMAQQQQQQGYSEADGQFTYNYDADYANYYYQQDPRYQEQYQLYYQQQYQQYYYPNGTGVDQYYALETADMGSNEQQQQQYDDQWANDPAYSTETTAIPDSRSHPSTREATEAPRQASPAQPGPSEEDGDGYYGEEDADLLDAYRAMTLERERMKKKAGEEGLTVPEDAPPVPRLPGAPASQSTASRRAGSGSDQGASWADDDDIYGGYAAITDEYGNTVPASTYHDENGGLVILTEHGEGYYINRHSYTALSAEAAKIAAAVEAAPVADEASANRDRAPSAASTASGSSPSPQLRPKLPSVGAVRLSLRLDFGPSSGSSPLSANGGELSASDSWATSALQAVSSETGVKLGDGATSPEAAPVTVKKFHLPSTKMRYMNSLLVDLQEQEQNVVLTAIREGASMPAIPEKYRRNNQPANPAPTDSSSQETQPQPDGSDAPLSPPPRTHVDDPQRAAHRRIIERQQAAAAAAIASIKSPTSTVDRSRQQQRQSDEPDESSMPRSRAPPSVAGSDTASYPSPPKSPVPSTEQGDWTFLRPALPPSSNRGSVLILHIPPPPRSAPPPTRQGTPGGGPPRGVGNRLSSLVMANPGGNGSAASIRSSMSSSLRQQVLENQHHHHQHPPPQSPQPMGGPQRTPTNKHLHAAATTDDPSSHRLSVMGVLELDPRPSPRALELQRLRAHNAMSDPTMVSSFVTPDHVRPQRLNHAIRDITVPTLVSTSSNLRTIPVAELQRKMRERGKLGASPAIGPAPVGMVQGPRTGLNVHTGPGGTAGAVQSPAPLSPAGAGWNHGPGSHHQPKSGSFPPPQQAPRPHSHGDPFRQPPYGGSSAGPTRHDSDGPATAPPVLHHPDYPSRPPHPSHAPTEQDYFTHNSRYAHGPRPSGGPVTPINTAGGSGGYGGPASGSSASAPGSSPNPYFGSPRMSPPQQAASHYGGSQSGGSEGPASPYHGGGQGGLQRHGSASSGGSRAEGRYQQQTQQAFVHPVQRGTVQHGHAPYAG
ncbi:hypothetical protein HDU96_002143 [Phlyctochytrium bullatum]|nr:hypothetical protein HDU96_002143 [Phlyctochytrium bullatum]